MGRPDVPEWAVKPQGRDGLHLSAQTPDGAKNYPIDQKACYLLGRSAKDVDILCDDRLCSRVHCCIVHDAHGHVFVVDLDSAHGTFVNGEELEKCGQARLEPGRSEIRLGTCSWSFKVQDQQAHLDGLSPRRLQAAEAVHARQRGRYSDSPTNEPRHDKQRPGEHKADRGRDRSHRDRRDRGRHDVDFDERQKHRHRDEYEGDIDRYKRKKRERDRSRSPFREHADRHGHHKSRQFGHASGRRSLSPPRRRQSPINPAMIRKTQFVASAPSGSEHPESETVAKPTIVAPRQKKALLWGGAAKSETHEARQFGANRWDTAGFQNESDRLKFNKLMGVKASSAQAAPQQEADAEREVLSGDAQNRVLTEVETHFMQGLRRADGRKVGLGL